MIEFEEYRKNLLRVNEQKNFKIKKCFGSQDSYRILKKNKEIPSSIYINTFTKIIGRINDLIASYIAQGNIFVLPYNMGKIQVSKSKATSNYTNNKLTHNYPIDWLSTIELWSKDAESREAKTLVRYHNNWVYKVVYFKKSAKYHNKWIYKFRAMRSLKAKIVALALNTNIEYFRFNNDKK